MKELGRSPANACSFSFTGITNLLAGLKLCHSDFDTTLTPPQSCKTQLALGFITDVSHLQRLRDVVASPESPNSRGNRLTPAELEVAPLCQLESADSQHDTYKVSVRQWQQRGDSPCIMKQGFQKASRFLIETENFHNTQPTLAVVHRFHNLINISVISAKMKTFTCAANNTFSPLFIARRLPPPTEIVCEESTPRKGGAHSAEKPIVGFCDIAWAYLHSSAV